MIGALPVVIVGNVIHVGGIFAIAAPRVAHVMEIIGAEDVPAKTPAGGEALVRHLHRAEPDIVDRGYVPAQMMQARTVRLDEGDHVVVAAMDRVHETNPVAGAVG